MALFGDLSWPQIFLFMGLIFGVTVYFLGWKRYTSYLKVNARISLIVLGVAIVFWYFFLYKKPNTGTLDEDEDL